jgi:hypothetical protein
MESECDWEKHGECENIFGETVSCHGQLPGLLFVDWMVFESGTMMISV